jgi:hypothetical protein
VQLSGDKNDENDDFSNFRFGISFRAGELQGSSQGVPKLKK